jgi:hypothetical protein
VYTCSTFGGVHTWSATAYFTWDISLLLQRGVKGVGLGSVYPNVSMGLWARRECVVGGMCGIHGLI